MKIIIIFAAITCTLTCIAAVLFIISEIQMKYKIDNLIEQYRAEIKGLNARLLQAQIELNRKGIKNE